MSLEKKLKVIKKLDEETVELMEDKTKMTAKVVQADIYKGTIYSMLLKAESFLKTTWSTSA